MKVKKAQALVVTPSSLDLRLARLKAINRQHNRPYVRKLGLIWGVASGIDISTLSLTKPYRELLDFAISYQFRLFRKLKMPLSVRALKSLEQSMLVLVQTGQDAGISPDEVRRMIIENAQSYTDWEAQPELEQRHSQMAGRSKFQRLG
jgi:hypothetical protein